MEIKTIFALQTLKFIYEEFDTMKYEGGGFVSIIVLANLKDNKDKVAKITISFHSLALKIADEGNYLWFGNDEVAEYPSPEDSERKIFLDNFLFEFFNTKYLENFNHTSSELHKDLAKHFCIRTMNEIIDFISESEPTVTVEYYDKTEYNKQIN